MSLFDKHPLTKKYETLFTKFGLTTRLRLSHFMAQADHESRLIPKSENLNYSITGLLGTFSRARISSVDAHKYGRTANKPANQEMIANTVYGGVWGRINLGNTNVGDGWKYRGRGIFQITGKANYSALTKWAKQNGINVDYVANPDLLLSEADSLIAALWFWSTRNLNSLADSDNIVAITKKINGGTNGLADRKSKLLKYKTIFS